MNYFDNAFNKTMIHEGWGKFSNNPNDPGGQTFSGISRRYWPNWEGWAILDTAVFPLYPDVVQQLMTIAKAFYKKNFWDIFKGDYQAAYSTSIAEEIFDTAVNLGPEIAIQFLQAGYNVAIGNLGNELVVDGLLGPKTVAAIKEYLSGNKDDEEILLNCMNGEQYIFYKNNPMHKYFRGWFRRV